MFANYLKTAWRNLLRNKLTGGINILGLSLGMGCCLLILLYVTHERSYDRWLPDADRIYRVTMDITNTPANEHMLFAPASGTLAPALMDFPQVEVATRIVPPFSESVPMGDGKEKIFYETGFVWADPNVFEIFDFEFLAGLPGAALQAPRDLVITRFMAEKYFGVTGNFDRLLGLTIRKDTAQYRITAVIGDIPENTSFRPDFIASLKEHEGNPLIENWHANVFHTFIRLAKNTDVAAFGNQIRHIADRYVGDEIKGNQQNYAYNLQPLTDIHLHSDLRFEMSKNNSWRQVQIFGLVAFVVLLLACINFVNLATARASRRAREVGIRKTTGARRSQLAFQFLGETLLMSFFSLAIALALVKLALPWFNQLADKQFSFADIWQSDFVWWVVGVALITGLLAGSYPAMALSRFKPVEALKSHPGKFATAGGASPLRNGLVMAQFAISFVLMVATAVISRQLDYLKTQNLGFDDEQMLVLHAPGNAELSGKYAAVRDELAKIPGVSSVSVTGIVPGKTFANNKVSLESDETKSTDMQLMPIDEKFLEAYGIELVAGRNLSEKIELDLSDNVLINESALAAYGWRSPEEALGKVFGGGWGTVVGVVRDFHFNSLHTKVLPLEMYFNKRRFSYVSLKIDAAGLDRTLADIKSKWASLVPSAPFNFSFLDEDFNRQYQAEERLSTLVMVFSALAIFIAALGLFGLATFIAEQRIKEIGIRKVLGATTAGIVGLLCKNFLKLVLAAILLATPVAWYFMRHWLADFAFRIDIGWEIFAVVGIAALAIAFFTIGFQSVKAALVNPARSLKNE